MSAIRGVPHERFTSRKVIRGPGGENGAVAILFLGLLPVIIGFCGLALELSQVYNRKAEMQSVADTVAVAAAFELDGTPAGVASAVQKAAARLTASAPNALTYQYSNRSMAWSESAVQFSTSPRGPWMPYGSAVAKAAPNGLLYVKVDTGELDPSYGQVNTLFMQFLSKDLAIVSVTASAVAGRSGIAVTPLGICAMRPEESRDRNGELEEYGFRRGVSYDLMQLNPDATAGGQTFLIDPFIGPGSTGTLASDTKTIAPFVCTGTMAVARVKGGAVSVSSPFPLGTFAPHLNSRFDTYTAPVAPCSPDSAPPDTNIKAYAYNVAGAVTWMGAGLTRQEAASSTADGKHWTVAGPDPTPGGTTADQFGVLWSYAMAVNYAASQPSGGYVPYAQSNWSTLYNSGLPKAGSTYPSVPPYFKAGYTKSPGHTGQLNRRVLNVALLSCPVSGNSATVAGIGKFFMPVATDGVHLYAEFAGLVPEQSLRAQVKLYP
jgi:Flp pilus assembly protein TadG